MSNNTSRRNPKLPDVHTGNQAISDRLSPLTLTTVAEVQKALEDTQAELDGFKDEKTLLQDRAAYLESQQRALAYPAHVRGDTQAQTELKQVGSELVDILETLLPCNEHNTQEAAAYLAGMQARLASLQADDLQAEVNRLESEALQAYLSSTEHTDKARQARVAFESFWKQRGTVVDKLQSMGRVTHDPVNFLQGDDNVRQAVEKRIAELRQAA